MKMVQCEITGEETESLLDDSETTISKDGIIRLCELYLKLS